MAEISDEVDDAYGLTVDDEDIRDLEWPLNTPERDLPDDETDYASITKIIDGETAAIALRWTGDEFILVGADGELERTGR